MRSRVVNLKQLCPQLTVEEMGRQMELAFGQVYGLPVEIMDLLSNNHELSVLGAPYLKLIGISYVFNMLSSLYVSARRSAEDAGFGMKLFAMSTVLNTG